MTYIANKTLNYIIKNKNKIFPQVEKKAAFFEKDLNSFFKKIIMTQNVTDFHQC